MRKPEFYYVHPIGKVVSFELVAKKHIQYARPYAVIHELHEDNLRHFYPAIKIPIAIHPFFYNASKLWPRFIDHHGNFRQEYLEAWRSRFTKVVGVDVADSDALSPQALQYLQLTDEMIVPSTWARDAYVRSGYTKRIHVLPHGVDPQWYTTSTVFSSTELRSKVNEIIKELYQAKKHGVKYLLFFLWHSAHRKGWAQLASVYKLLRARRKDIILIVKTVTPWPKELQELKDYGVINVYGWLDDVNKMALYDLADITLNFSLGGGFEMNCLEALARGKPCIAGEKGGWSDYLPKFLAIKQCGKEKPLPGNPIHSGWGYKVCIEDALSMIEYIIDNYDDVLAKVSEHRKKLSTTYRWDLIGKRFVEILSNPA